MQIERISGAALARQTIQMLLSLTILHWMQADNHFIFRFSIVTMEHACLSPGNRVAGRRLPIRFNISQAVAEALSLSVRDGPGVFSNHTVASIRESPEREVVRVVLEY